MSEAVLDRIGGKDHEAMGPLHDEHGRAGTERSPGHKGGWPGDQSERRDRWVFRHITGPMSRKDIIRSTGLSAASVSRSLKEMEAKGIVARHSDGLFRPAADALAKAGWTQEELDVGDVGRALELIEGMKEAD